MNTTKSTMICYTWGMKNNQNQFQILSQLAFKTRKMELMTFKNNLREILQYTMLPLEMLWLWPCLDYACTQKPQSCKVLSQPGKAFAKKIGPSFWHCPDLQKWSVIQTSMNWKRKKKKKRKNNNKQQQNPVISTEMYERSRLDKNQEEKNPAALRFLPKTAHWHRLNQFFTSHDNDVHFLYGSRLKSSLNNSSSRLCQDKS